MISFENIDKRLETEFSLGFLFNDIFPGYKRYLPIITILRLLPKIDGEFNLLRERLEIDPVNNNAIIEKLVGKEKYKYYLNDINQLVFGPTDTELNDDYSLKEVSEIIDKFENQYFPEIDLEIKKIEKNLNLKSSKLWRLSIKMYVLYNIVFVTPAIYHKTMPEISTEAENGCVVLKLYPDTDLGFFFKKSKAFKKIQECFKTFYNPENQEENVLKRRFFYYVLRKKMDINAQDSSDWLQERGFGPVDIQYDSQEIDRFLSTFFNST